MPQLFKKDPAAVLDYVFDWKSNTNGNGGSDYLQSGETVSSFTVTADSGLTVDSSSATDTNTSVTAWLSGGTAGETYRVVCQIVSSAGRADERSIFIQVEQR